MTVDLKWSPTTSPTLRLLDQILSPAALSSLTGERAMVPKLVSFRQDGLNCLGWLPS